MHQFKKLTGACLFAGLLAACSGQNTSSLIPSSAPPGSDGTAPIAGQADTTTTQAIPNNNSSLGTSSTNPDPNAALSSGGSSVSPDAVTMSTGVARHVLTASYLGRPFGSTTVSPSRAAPYLSWASTGVQNTNAMAAVGMKTEVYVDANRQTSTDPLYIANEAAFNHACGGARIHDYFDRVTQYLMNNGSSTFRAAYAAYVRTKTAGYHVDAMYEDDTVAPSQYGSGFFSPGLPCGYTLSGWLNAERGMEASINHSTIVNGLSAFVNHGPAANVIALTENPSTIGANLESCYVANGSVHEEGSWVWTATENTEIELAGRHKLFQCMPIDTTAAAYAVPSRIWTIASFLMTYNPSYSMIWENYGTPSKVGVMPESQLVPTSPLVATPSNISGLEKSAGVYAREYRTCYYAGHSIGQCAVVVNSNRYSAAAPRLSLAYHHTMQLHGYGVLDGGTATFAGSAHPSTMGALSAFVAVP